MMHVLATSVGFEKAQLMSFDWMTKMLRSNGPDMLIDNGRHQASSRVHALAVYHWLNRHNRTSFSTFIHAKNKKRASWVDHHIGPHLNCYKHKKKGSCAPQKKKNQMSMFNIFRKATEFESNWYVQQQQKQQQRLWFDRTSCFGKHGFSTTKQNIIFLASCTYHFLQPVFFGRPLRRHFSFFLFFSFHSCILCAVIENREFLGNFATNALDFLIIFLHFAPFIYVTVFIRMWQQQQQQ